MTVAFLFPGQGSQTVGMGRGLFARFPDLTRQADDLLGYSIERLCLEDPDKRLNLTRYTQPALYVTGALAYLARREDEGLDPAFAAGHSLGEYGALFAAGCFDFATGLALVRERARLMGEVTGTGMTAVTRIDAGRLSALLAEDPRFGELDVANYNTLSQTVVSGDLGQLKALAGAVEGLGGQCFPLRVSAAFHSHFMQPAQRRFAEFAAGFAFRPPRIPVVANLTAAPYPADSDGIRDTLVGQLASPVRWSDTIAWLHHRGVDRFVEIGPGQVLTRMNGTILADLARDGPARREAFYPAPAALTGPPPGPAATPVVAKPPALFLCPGQGGQHYRMGRDLHAGNGAFRNAFDACDRLARPWTGQPLAEIVYESGEPAEAFSRTLHTHLANFAFGYAMVASLRADGVEPAGFVAWSLGEYVALAAAGALGLEEAVSMVGRQAQLVEAHTPPASMLSVLENVNIFYSLDNLFAGCTLAGIHTDACFVVTGTTEVLAGLRRGLGERNIACHKLPIRHGFHSSLMDPVEVPFKAACAPPGLAIPGIPVYSSVERGRLAAADTTYLWRVCRSRFNFRTALLLAVEACPGAVLYDIGPSGTSAVHAKAILGKGKEVRHALRRS